MPTPMVQVDRLTKNYGRVAALSDVSLAVGRGDVLGLIGPNGAGKTTLFECIAGVLPYDSGSMSFGGQRLTAAAQAARVFYMPDGIVPWPAQTVAWALDFAVGFFGGAAAAAGNVIERLDLAPLLGARVGALSKGQRKRVLLGIAMLTPHPLLLCDEPFDGLDLRQTREIGVSLRDHAAEGRTLFLSIHQISDAARFCDRFVLLSGGRVRGEGTLDELAHRVPSSSADPARPSNLEEIFLALT